MKYIRTKDGRIIDLNSKLVSSYEIVDDKTAIEEYAQDSGFICVYYFDKHVGDHIEYDNKGGCSMDNWYLKDIIEQADTIEELCDCYSYETETTRDYLVAKSWKKADTSRHIYGCILTDTGIIRVAKMNDKGELELL